MYQFKPPIKNSECDKGNQNIEKKEIMGMKSFNLRNGVTDKLKKVVVNQAQKNRKKREEEREKELKNGIDNAIKTTRQEIIDHLEERIAQVNEKYTGIERQAKLTELMQIREHIFKKLLGL